MIQPSRQSCKLVGCGAHAISPEKVVDEVVTAPRLATFVEIVQSVVVCVAYRSLGRERTDELAGKGYSGCFFLLKEAQSLALQVAICRKIQEQSTKPGRSQLGKL